MKANSDKKEDAGQTHFHQKSTYEIQNHINVHGSKDIRGGFNM